MGATEQGESTEEGAVEEEQLSLYDTEPDKDKDDDAEEYRYESVEDTIQRIRGEAEAKPSQEGEQGKPSEGSGQDNRQTQAAAPEGQKPAQPSQEAVEPPSRLSAEAKEWFKGADPTAKSEIVKIVRDLENGQRNVLHQIHSVKTEAEQIVQGVAPFVKDWSTRGISASQGIALLAQTHERMLENPAKEIARLIEDNDISLDDIEEVMNGGEPRGSNGTAPDISSHPQFMALQKQQEYLINRAREEEVKAETDRIKALADETDATGNRPYQHITNPAFLEWATPERITALRTPPRNEFGQFTGAPKSLVEAYKEAYGHWKQRIGAALPQTQPSSTPLATQPKRKLAEPVSGRSRNARVNGTPVDPNFDPSKYRHETVEETVQRIRSQNRG